ncbi:MAG: hypothetical protein ACI9GO_001196 [Bacteroidia bacterium]|jgi:hypothetical protein
MENGIHLNQSSGATYPFEHNLVIRTISGGDFGTAIRCIDFTESAIMGNTLDFESNEK